MGILRRIDSCFSSLNRVNVSISTYMIRSQRDEKLFHSKTLQHERGLFFFLNFCNVSNYAIRDILAAKSLVGAPDETFFVTEQDYMSGTCLVCE